MEAFCGVFGLVAFVFLVIMLFMAAGKIAKTEKRSKKLERDAYKFQADLLWERKKTKKYKLLASHGCRNIQIVHLEGHSSNPESDFAYEVTGSYDDIYFVIKRFEYDPNDNEAKEFARLQAEELAEIISK